ncbi:hypothetical protein B0H15DRAFT_806815 [Mycena belliarum]|uniref:Uncharacterized protein n=1 Tax=Mycena belliarum TaxID=1033014 RepID=A0AAD6TRC8_9AGAR|nr:hypothetical protein B0H15DRAFT_806815 [Mycena belliae]
MPFIFTTRRSRGCLPFKTRCAFDHSVAGACPFKHLQRSKKHLQRLEPLPWNGLTSEEGCENWKRYREWATPLDGMMVYGCIIENPNHRIWGGTRELEALRRTVPSAATVAKGIFEMWDDLTETGYGLFVWCLAWHPASRRAAPGAKGSIIMETEENKIEYKRVMIYIMGPEGRYQIWDNNRYGPEKETLGVGSPTHCAREGWDVPPLMALMVGGPTVDGADGGRSHHQQWDLPR